MARARVRSPRAEQDLLSLGEQVGSVSRGASRSVLSALPRSRLTEADVAALSGESASCVICFEDYAPRDLVATLPCFHRFHHTCVEKWLQRDAVCPVCRAKVKVDQ